MNKTWSGDIDLPLFGHMLREVIQSLTHLLARSLTHTFEGALRAICAIVYQA